MSTVCEEPITAKDAASSILQGPSDKAHTPLDVVFKPWPAVRIIEHRLKGFAQLIAIHCARRTPKSGSFKFRHSEMAEWAGCSEHTVARLMPTIITSGLLERKRTRDGYVYRWTTAAYGSADGPTTSDKSLRSGVLIGADTDSSAAERLAVAERLLVVRYLQKRKSKYGAHPKLPSSQHLATISQQSRDVVLPDIVFAASQRTDCENFDAALERTIDAVLGFYFANDGSGDWLKNHHHPLDAMRRDMPKIMSLVFKLKAYRAPEIRDEKLERISSDVSAHKCACGEQATRYWLGREGNRESGAYTCSKRECGPLADGDGDEHNETRLGEKQHRAVDVSQLRGANREETAPVGIELVHALFDSRASNGVGEMPPVPRKNAAKPARQKSPHLGRLMAIFGRFERCKDISEDVIDGLLELFEPDDLIRVVPEAARQLPQGQTTAQLKAWFFKRVQAKAA